MTPTPLDSLSQDVLVRFTSKLEGSTLPTEARTQIAKDAAEIFQTQPGGSTEKLFAARQAVARELNEGNYSSAGIPDRLVNPEGYSAAGAEMAKAFESAQKLLEERLRDAAPVSYRDRLRQEIPAESRLQPQRG